MKQFIAFLPAMLLLLGCGSAPTESTFSNPVGGVYEVLGTKKHNDHGVGGLSSGANGAWSDNSPVEISWKVKTEQVAALKAGMTLDGVREVLGLESLKYTPNGPKSELHLVCKSDSPVTLVFKGYPESKLAEVQGEGSK